MVAGVGAQTATSRRPGSLTREVYASRSGTGYQAMSGSLVTSLPPSRRVCPMIRRSNGSRWGGERENSQGVGHDTAEPARPFGPPHIGWMISGGSPMASVSRSRRFADDQWEANPRQPSPFDVESLKCASGIGPVPLSKLAPQERPHMPCADAGPSHRNSRPRSSSKFSRARGARPSPPGSTG